MTHSHQHTHPHALNLHAANIAVELAIAGYIARASNTVNPKAKIVCQ